MSRDDFAAIMPATRCLHRYSHEARADMAASHRLGHRQRHSMGEYFWMHPALPSLALPTRKRALDLAYAEYLAGRFDPIVWEHPTEVA